MSRFLALVAFELRYYMTRISTHVYFLIFAALGFFIAVATGGAFDQIAVGVGGGGGIVKVNSPHVIFGLTSAMSLFGIIVVAAISGNAVYRDYEADIHPLFFTSPVPRLTYLGSRFIGSVLVNTYVMAGIGAGVALGFAMPFLDAKALGPTMPMAYVHPYLLVIVPNLVLTGAIFFALAAFTRLMLPNYLGGVVMLIGYTIAGVLAANVEHETLAALLDPFGFTAFEQITKYWTPAERNVQFVPLTGLLLVNRLIWMGVGAAVFLFVAWRFRFRHLASERMDRRRQFQEWANASSDYQGAIARREGLKDAHRRFDVGAHVVQLVSTARRGFMGIVTSVYFQAMAVVGILLLVVNATQLSQIYGTTTWPVTYQIVELLAASFALPVLVIITLYAGDLVWQERDRKMHQVHDSLPIPTWVPFLGKLAALLGVVVVLQAVMMACGIALQAAKGYFRFEPGLYVRELFGLQLVSWALLMALILLVHALVNNKYLGHFIVILYFIGSASMGRFGLQHLLYRYNSDTGTTYSDMNEFGPFLGPFGWLKLYWAGVALVLAVLTNLFWVRGQEATAGWRLALARQRFSRPALAVAGASVVVVLLTGAFIFWNTNVRNEYQTTFEAQAVSARYEKEYSQFATLPQPRVVASVVDVTFWPKRLAGRAKGTLTAINKTAGPITSLHVQLPAEAEISQLEFDPPARREKHDEELGYLIYALEQPLQPGHEIRLTYDLGYEEKGFSNTGVGTAIVENGTFVNSALLPSFGYSEGGELGDDDTRRKHGLEPKERMAAVDDLAARQNTYISRDADWIDFEATVCTDPDQLAIAPGYLEEEFTRDDRRCFRYAMDAPILNFYSFLSARYVVKKDSWHDVAIEVWHHPGHEYNVETMIRAVKKSLDVYTTAFGPYQHRQVRIVEFPRYASFAQSFPNTIPYSESIGFIARVKDPQDDIDYPLYVTAHEIAHQWFAHQIIGGNVQGSTMLSESFSQYAALKVMEQEYGQDQLVKFIKYELDRYLTGRTIERKKELPLYLVENQQYIHYAKGSVVLYALADYIGPDRFDEAMRSYLGKVKFQQPPYTTTLEFLAELRAVTPPDLQYLIDDMLVNVTLYDTRVTSAEAEKLPDGKWKVTLTILAKKMRADEEGAETEVPMNDLVDVGVFVEGPRKKLYDLEPLALERRRIPSGESTVSFVVDQRPQKAGVDPRLLLIDRHLDDNIVTVKDKAPEAPPAS